MLSDPLDDLVENLGTYREEVASVTDGLHAEAPAWERGGAIPADLYRRFGATAAFRARWEGGDALGTRHAAHLARELALVSPSLALALVIHTEMFVGILHETARSEAQREVLALALAGDAIGCVASTEETGGSDITGIGTRAVRDGKGWRVTGTKRFVTSGSTATHGIVSAVGARPGSLVLFLVPLDHPGVLRSPPIATVGMRACDTAALELDLKLDDEWRVGPIGLGVVPLARALRRERFVASVQLVTVATKALGLAIQFARTRRNGGARLMDRQAIRHRLADQAARLRAAQCHVAWLAEQLERNQPCDADVAATKLCCAQVAIDVIDDAVQVFGGRGYTEDFPLEGLWRDARLGRIGGGADEVMREIIASDLDRSDDEVLAELANLEASARRRLSPVGVR
ncbi:MAG: acyl-CoA dehydrogenase family protein [Ilumatobacteraceae bacterium]